MTYNPVDAIVKFVMQFATEKDPRPVKEVRLSVEAHKRLYKHVRELMEEGAIHGYLVGPRGEIILNAVFFSCDGMDSQMSEEDIELARMGCWDTRCFYVFKDIEALTEEPCEIIENKKGLKK